jgi:hypothetical protein
LGDYEPRINGQQVSQTGINQPWSQYEKTIYYQEFDVARHLLQGTNSITIGLTNSFWHNLPAPVGRYYKQGPQRHAAEPLLLCAELDIELADGTELSITTDEDWLYRKSPVVFSHVYAGEDFDARLTQSAGNTPGPVSNQWEKSHRVDPPKADLVRQHWPSFKEIEEFGPQSIKQVEPGVWLYAFPRNCAAQLRVSLAAGDSGALVTLRCGEHKNEKDRLFGHYVVQTTIITDGSEFSRQWSSFYLGMQFVEVEGAVPVGQPNPDNLPVINALQLVQVRTGLKQVGKFTCSEEVLNQAHALIDAAMQANASHVITDCPHREKLGWLEVPYLMGPSFQYRYGCQEWFKKILRDICDAQETSGRVLTVAPSYPAGQFPDKFNFTVEWGAAAVLLPWHHYHWHGDKEILRENFEMMRQFADYVASQTQDGLAPGGLGDWYDYGHGQPPGESRFTPTQLSATATWAMCVLAVADAADALDKTELSKKYRNMHSRISADFVRHYAASSGNGLKPSVGSQAANAMTFCSKLLPQPARQSLVEGIIGDLEARSWQQTPGDIGHVYLIRTLAEAGRSDLLEKVYTRQEKGSYGGIAAKGHTSLPETWDAMMDGYQSLNHCMLGHGMEWLYAYVAGIRQQPDSIGWKKILIAPNPGTLDYAKATFEAPTGRIEACWVIKDGHFNLMANIPENTEAKAVLPSGSTIDLNAGRNQVSEKFVRKQTD